MNILNIFKRKKVDDNVTFDNINIIRTRNDGVQETIRWDALCQVGVLTTDEGPFQEDVFLLLVGANEKSGCAIPQFSKGFDQLLERLQKLPAFDNESFIEAMTSTSNAKFICWER